MSVETESGPVQVFRLKGAAALPGSSRDMATVMQAHISDLVNDVVNEIYSQPTPQMSADNSPHWTWPNGTPAVGSEDSSVQNHDPLTQTGSDSQHEPDQPLAADKVTHRSYRVRSGLYKQNKHNSDWPHGKRAVALVSVVAAMAVSGFVGHDTGTPEYANQPSLSQNLANAELTSQIPQLEFENQSDLSAEGANRTQQLLREAHLALAAYEPVVVQAAQDPRTGNPDVLPNHQDETILLLALLLRGDPNNATGPIPIPNQTSNPVFTELVQQMNQTNTEEGLNLSPLKANEQNISTNLMAAILQIRQLYQEWVNDQANAGKPIASFVGYYFGGLGSVAMPIYSAWSGRYNLPYQRLITSNAQEATDLQETVIDLAGAGLITSQSNK